MIKVPVTPAGIPAIEELTARGVNVNITLLFALRRYDEVIDAYMSGLERRAARDDPLDHIASVASFFVSRIDTKADDELPPGSPLRGTIAVTNARQAFRLHEKRFTDARWRRLAAQGARDQRPLWASTGTKNPTYSDVLYVEQLIAPGVVNTMPQATLEAFDDHGNAQFPPIDVGDPAGDLAGVDLRAAGVDLDRITTALEREGVEAFSSSYEQLVSCIRRKLRNLVP
jgi:transaldolase